MLIFFIITTIFEIIELIFSYKKSKKIISVHSVFFFGIILNFILYLCNWSTFFSQKCSDLTFIIICTCQIIVIFCDVLYIFKKKSKKSNLEIKYKPLLFNNSKKIYFSIIILTMCLCLVAVENYLSYHTIFPFFNNIDSHKSHLSIIGTAWKVLYPIGLLMFVMELKWERKSKLVWFYVILISAYILLGNGSRFWSVLNIATAVIYYLLTNKISFKKIIKISIPIIIFGFIILQMGLFRINNATMTYSQMIGYNGPFVGTPLENIAAWIYGYFPYSFYNLNLTLTNIETYELSTHGLFFIHPFLTTLKLHKLFGLPSYSDIALSIRVITNPAATVATAFFEFYSDFGILFFVPFTLFLIFLYELQRRDGIYFKAVFSYFLVCFFFFNFYNVISIGIPYTFLLVYTLLYFLLKTKNNRGIL